MQPTPLQWQPWYDFISIDTLPELPNSEWWGTLLAHTPRSYMLANVLVGDSVCYLFHNGNGGASSEHYMGTLYYRENGDTIFWKRGDEYQPQYLVTRVSESGDSVVVKLFNGGPTDGGFSTYAYFVRVER